MKQRFPIDSINQDTSKDKDIHLFDSLYYRGGVAPGGAIMPASASFNDLGIFYITTPANLSALVISVTCFTDKNMWVELHMYPPYGANQAGMVYRTHAVINNADVIKQLKFDLNPGILMPENSRIAFRYSLLAGETGTPKFSISTNTILKSIDTDAAKPYKMGLFTDSIGWAIAGNSANSRYAGFPAFSNEYYPSLLRTYLEESFMVSIQLQTYSFGGSNSASMLQHINSMGNAPYTDLAIISEGMNDAAGSVISPADYVNNVLNIYYKIKSRNRSGSVLILAPSSTDDTATRPNIQAFRDAIQTAFVTTLSGKMIYAGGGINGISRTAKVLFADLSSAYPAGSTTHFSDNNPRIHPNSTNGHPALFNTIKPIIDACPWRIFN